MKITLTQLKDVAKKAILNYGYTLKEADTILEILLFAQLRGNNQGVVKLIGGGIPKRETATEPKIVKETAVSARIDGNHTHAMIVLDLATNMAIEKAKKVGVGIVGNFNSSESTGALGYYTSKIAEAGLIGIAYATSPFKTTAPYGSTEALFCTNPISYGIPTLSEPIILDMTTSAMAYYGLIEAKTAGRSVGEEVGYDKNGHNTSDPAAIMAGALRTFGGHRGSGLALVGQIFAGALVGADSFDSESDNAGNLIIAINPSLMLDEKEFLTEVSRIQSVIKSARKAEGISEIFLPGERGDRLTQHVLKTGEIEIEENLWKQLLEKSC